MELESTSQRLQKLVRRIGAFCWASSLLLPAFGDVSSQSTMLGFMCLVFGGFSIGYAKLGWGAYAWVANPVAAIGYLGEATRRTKYSGTLSCIAFVIGSTSLFVTELPSDESGNNFWHVKPMIGAYVWIFSLLGPAFAAVIRRVYTRDGSTRAP